MGMVHVDLVVSGPRGTSETVRFLVDSGATISVLPWRVWRKLRLRPERTVEFSLIDGTVIRRRVSEARFTYGDRSATSPLVLGERNDDALLGALTLEALGLVLNPFERTLQPMRVRLGRVSLGAPA